MFQFALKLCEEHHQKELHAYCNTCEKKICSSCIKVEHNQHDWETITEIVRAKKRSLPEECKEIRANHIPVLEEEIERFERQIQRGEAAFEQNKSVLNSSRQSYVDQINNLFDARIDECRQKHEKATTIYRKYRDGLKQKKEYLEMMTTALDKDINTLPDHDILDMAKDMKDELEKALSYTADKYTCTTMYVPGQMNVQALEDMIGEIQNVSVEEKYDINRYFESIHSINPVSDTNAWIMTLADNFAKLLNRTGEEIKTMSTPCDEIVVLGSAAFVLINELQHLLSVLMGDESIETTICTKQLLPIFISKTANDEILVALRDEGDNFDLITTSRRIIQRMTLTGEVVQTYEFREDGKTRLFTIPTRMTENKNTDICVVNWLMKESGELIVLKKDGRVKFTYRGEELKSEKFDPVDVECDEKCRILFTEVHSGAIHMLSAEGMFLCTLCQYEQLHPWPISFYGNYLWCGFYNGRVKVFKYTSN
ncbi:hypothetical protein FSP39_012904 [Pinctada imbricata]|uniref:B box-type domain-containing protein n=1 Tax=Pinctada imbricata TaxID=66713 RepID=A0AA88YCB5_PINIB|nr:hypothetical protein FSP39_012904 [Pinctada imbricata]